MFFSYECNQKPSLKTSYKRHTNNFRVSQSVFYQVKESFVQSQWFTADHLIQNGSIHSPLLMLVWPGGSVTVRWTNGTFGHAAVLSVFHATSSSWCVCVDQLRETQRRPEADFSAPSWINFVFTDVTSCSVGRWTGQVGGQEVSGARGP